MRSYVPNELVGQGFALQQLTDAVCDHMAEDSPARPLVLSLHGPPGVGKTLFHRLLAQAVYNATDAATVRARFYATSCMHRLPLATRRNNVSESVREGPLQACPGAGCPGYHVVFGMDYVAAQQQEQSAQAQVPPCAHRPPACSTRLVPHNLSHSPLRVTLGL
jgi:hypothetical protein